MALLFAYRLDGDLGGVDIANHKININNEILLR
jgi:hypothetical protein